MKFILIKVVYPNFLKYSEFDAKFISENRLLLFAVEKKVIDKIKSKKSENFGLNRIFSQNVYKPKLILKSNKGC